MGSLTNQLTSLAEMDQQIGFAVLTEINHNGAQITSLSEPSYDHWAKIRYIDTNEAELGTQQEKFRVDIKVWIRYDSNVTQEHYVYWNEKYYDIYAIEGTPRDRFTVIKAKLIET